MTLWDPDKYLRFDDQRTRPAVDLVSRIALDAPKTIIDLGCGPGNSTQVLWQRWPSAQVRGLDNSPEMVDAAKQSYPDQEWLHGDIADWRADAPQDVVFSNAALQWVHDHVGLTRHLFDQVAPGGALAFQIPSRDYAAVAKFIDEISQDGEWAARTAAPRAALTMEHPSVYYDALAGRAASLDIWETEYQHVMESADAIVAWIAATGLPPFLAALETDEERARFVALLTGRVADGYPQRSDGRVLFPFRRTFVIAYA